MLLTDKAVEVLTYLNGVLPLLRRLATAKMNEEQTEKMSEILTHLIRYLIKSSYKLCCVSILPKNGLLIWDGMILTRFLSAIASTEICAYVLYSQQLLSDLKCTPLLNLLFLF